MKISSFLFDPANYKTREYGLTYDGKYIYGNRYNYQLLDPSTVPSFVRPASFLPAGIKRVKDALLSYDTFPDPTIIIESSYWYPTNPALPTI